jgi:hypothetical protein
MIATFKRHLYTSGNLLCSAHPCTPLDVVMVLGLSGNMVGTKLALLKKAMVFIATRWDLMTTASHSRVILLHRVSAHPARAWLSTRCQSAPWPGRPNPSSLAVGPRTRTL